MADIPEKERVRLDQWLWAARFFKTRSLARQAIEKGQVLVEGQKPKPAREVQVGACIRVRQGWDEKTVRVTGLASKRGSATIAATLYDETPESLALTERKAAERKAAGVSRIITDGKPDKRRRRQIHRFLTQNPMDPAE